MTSATKWRKRLREDVGSFVGSEDSHSLKTTDLLATKESDHHTSVVNSSLELRSGYTAWRNSIPQNTAIAVTSEHGETVQLKSQVCS